MKWQWPDQGAPLDFVTLDSDYGFLSICPVPHPGLFILTLLLAPPLFLLLGFGCELCRSLGFCLILPVMLSCVCSVPACPLGTPKPRTAQVESISPKPLSCPPAANRAVASSPVCCLFHALGPCPVTHPDPVLWLSSLPVSLGLCPLGIGAVASYLASTHTVFFSFLCRSRVHIFLQEKKICQ